MRGNMSAQVVSFNRVKSGMRYPLIQRVEAYWEALRTGDALPQRGAVDPRGLGDALPVCFVAEHVGGGQLRLRIAGQSITRIAGVEARGMALTSLIAPDQIGELERHAERMINGREVLRLGLVADLGNGRRLRGEMILLPLGNTEGEVDRVLGCILSDAGMTPPACRFRINGVSTRSAGQPYTDVMTTWGATPDTTPAYAAEAPAGFAHEKGPRDIRAALKIVSGDKM